MDLYLLAELKTITLKVTTVDMSRPPKDFRAMFDSTNPPILVDGDQIVLENEKIERYIMKSIPGGHNLFVSDKATSDVIENIYTVSSREGIWKWILNLFVAQKFKLMMSKNDEHSHANFRSLLQRIDEHLAKRKTRYLTGDTLVCFDCELMSRLQHIRIAGKSSWVGVFKVAMLIILALLCTRQASTFASLKYLPSSSTCGRTCITCTIWKHSASVVQPIRT